MSNNQKRREDACALPKSGRCRTKPDKRLDEFRSVAGMMGKAKTKSRLRREASIKCTKAASIRGQRSPRGKEFLLTIHSKLAIRVA
jgi:hypothetical protein